MNKNTLLSPRLVIGIIFILLGSLILLDNYDGIFFNIPDFIFEWQMLFIFLGATLLLTVKNKTPGIILIAIGLFNYFPELWPIVFILIGLAIMYRRNIRERFFSKRLGLEWNHSSSSDEDFEDISIFGGGTRNYHSDNFKGGRIVSIFGGSEIRLTDSILSEGENIIDITTLFGGNTIWVPRNWYVEIDVMPVFGGFSDKRLKDPNLVFDHSRKLIVRGIAIFGGGELKSY